MMSNRPIVVIDASVATKWHLRDEQMTAEADAVLSAYRRDAIILIAPGCIRYEVPSSICKSLRTNRMTMTTARQAITAFLSLGISVFDDGDLLLDAFDVSIRIGCSLHDAMYLALADAMNCTFIHADGRLANALAGRLATEVWLADWANWFANVR